MGDDLDLAEVVVHVRQRRPEASPQKNHQVMAALQVAVGFP